MQSNILTVIWNLIFLDNMISINKSNKYQDTYSTFTNLLNNNLSLFTLAIRPIDI